MVALPSVPVSAPMVSMGMNLRPPLPCSTIPQMRNWWLRMLMWSPTFCRLPA